jgi:hypothetical protein
MSDTDSEPDQPVAPGKEKRSRDPDRWIHRPMEKYRKGKHQLELRPSDEFFALADPVVQSKRTLLGYDRLYVFWQALRNLVDVPGAAAEIGSFRGGSAFFIASAFRRVMGEEVLMHVFDTFEGHPEQAITHNDPFHTPGQFAETSYDDVRAYLSPFERLQIHKGDVSASLPHIEESAYRLVHIDTDLYQPTRVCLDYFGERISPGGVIVIDDYASKKCPGVPKAVSEYLERTDRFQAWDMRTEQLMLVKR